MIIADCEVSTKVAFNIVLFNNHHLIRTSTFLNFISVINFSHRIFFSHSPNNWFNLSNRTNDYETQTSIIYSTEWIPYSHLLTIYWLMITHHFTYSILILFISCDMWNCLIMIMLIVFIPILLTFRRVSFCRLMILSWIAGDSFVVCFRHCVLVGSGSTGSCQSILADPRDAPPHEKNPHPNSCASSYTYPCPHPPYSSPWPPCPPCPPPYDTSSWPFS